MKKLLGIVVLGLLWCNNAYADDKKVGHVYHKDAHSISIKLGPISGIWGLRANKIATEHCAKHKKFVFRFRGDSKNGVNSSQIYHCNAEH